MQEKNFRRKNMKKDFKMRTGLIVGEDGLDKLKNANVIVFGVKL